MQDYEFVDAISYAQPGGVFYACTLPAVDIIKRLDIHRRRDNPSQGVQREDNPTRVKDISTYARASNAIFPTPIIVSAYGGGIEIVDKKLRIPNGNSTLGHILDGQHRVLGLKTLSDEDLREFDLLIVFVFEIDLYSEAAIFSTINSTQKQVSKSLMYDLFSLHSGRSEEKTAHEIVRSLNDDSESPFYKRIKILGKKMGAAETLSQAAFVDQIARQLKDRNGILRSYYAAEQDWAIRKIISNCFAGLKKAHEQINNESFPEDYFFRTSGFGGVAQALEALLQLGRNNSDVSEEFFREIFGRMFDILEGPPEGVGNAAMLRIKESILQAITQS